ncbi:MAG: hypothetical protein DRP15_02845 [Candidatus Aenigmatarchaeota archaeon]|nr:MAG: hypothetical protein DRP15_02845 [Candidatus Aenigmarchaeota archaeon]
MEIINFSDLTDKDKRKVYEFYTNAWRRCLEPELGCDDFDVLIKEVERRFEDSDKKMPELQKVLVTKEKTCHIPVVVIRSNIIKVNDNYPLKWIIASGNGRADNFDPEGNIMLCYAITRNPDVKVKGANFEILKERYNFSSSFGLEHLDAYSTLTGFHRFPEIDDPWEYIHKMLEEGISDPVGMHFSYIKRLRNEQGLPEPKPEDVIMPIPEGRIDPLSKNYNARVRYF